MATFKPTKNVADELISKYKNPQQQPQEAEPKPEPAASDRYGFVYNEKKTKHLQLLFPESVYNEIDRIAKYYRISKNEFMLTLAKRYLEDEDERAKRGE